MHTHPPSSSSKHRASARKHFHGQVPGKHSAPAAPPRRSDCTPDNDQSDSLSAVWRSVLFALPLAALFGLALLLIATAIALSAEDPDALIPPLAMAALGLTALADGLITARRCGHHALLCGLASGFVLSLLLWIFTFFVDRTDPTMTLGISPTARFALHAAVLALTSAGSLLGRRR